MKAIGIDIGTTSICGIVMDAKTGEVLNSRTISSNAFVDTGKCFEKVQDVEKIVTIAKGIVDEFVSDDVVAIGVTGQMHGIVYVDENGKAVSNLYTWQDERGNEEYKGTTYAKYLGSFSGYGNVTDFYNRENGLVPENAVSFCTIHDYFVMTLCDLKEPLVHESDAASFGFFDVEKGEFTNGLNLSVAKDFVIAGNYKNIPVSVAIGDNQASVFSTLTDEDNGVLLNVGTGSQISVISDKKVVADNIETRPYFNGKFLIVGAALCGGRAFSYLKDFYKNVVKYIKPDVTEGEIYKMMDKMVLDAEKTTLKVDTRFAGTRFDTSIRGSVSNISQENFNPENLTVGVLCGIVGELYEMYEKMNVKRCSLVGSGNGLRKNPPLVRNAQEQFDAKLYVPYHLEEAAVGAALYALVAGKVFENSKDAQKLVKYVPYSEE